MCRMSNAGGNTVRLCLHGRAWLVNPNAHNIALLLSTLVSNGSSTAVNYWQVFQMVKMLLWSHDLVKADLGVDYWITSWAGDSMKPFYQKKSDFPSNQRICVCCSDGRHVFRWRCSHAPSVLLLENKVFSAGIHRPLDLPKIRPNTNIY